MRNKLCIFIELCILIKNLKLVDSIKNGVKEWMGTYEMSKIPVSQNRVRPVSPCTPPVDTMTKIDWFIRKKAILSSFHQQMDIMLPVES